MTSKNKKGQPQRPIMMEFKITDGWKVLHKGNGRADQVYRSLSEFCELGLGIDKRRKRKF